MQRSIDNVKKILKSQLSSDEKLHFEWLRKAVGSFPPGHFYSPLPNPEEVERDKNIIWGETPQEIESIDLNLAGQLEFFHQIKRFYEELPFPEKKTEQFRYYFENPAYSYSDAIILFCIMRHLQPKRVIEVGSGFSSCLMLDTNDIFLEGRTDFTFVEPYPQLLQSLIKNNDSEKIKIISTRLQDVDVMEFDKLERNDILFIDSTHVSKINSDVNYLFFKILPRLKQGVYVHIHDIFYPFEYPKHWLDEGRAWNENYILRAFLQFNNAFKIVCFSTYLQHFHENNFKQYMSLCLRNKGGCIWLQRQ